MALARHGSSRLRLAVAAGLLLAPAAHLATAEDLVVLRAGDSRSGTLQSCDAERCQLNGKPVPRSGIAWIGLAQAAGAPPKLQSAATDQVVLRSGAVERGELTGISLGVVLLGEVELERAAVAWIRLADPGAVAADLPPAAGESGLDVVLRRDGTALSGELEGCAGGACWLAGASPLARADLAGIAFAGHGEVASPAGGLEQDRLLLAGGSSRDGAVYGVSSEDVVAVSGTLDRATVAMILFADPSSGGAGAVVIPPAPPGGDALPPPPAAMPPAIPPPGAPQPAPPPTPGPTPSAPGPERGALWTGACQAVYRVEVDDCVHLTEVHETLRLREYSNPLARPVTQNGVTTLERVGSLIDLEPEGTVRTNLYTLTCPGGGASGQGTITLDVAPGQPGYGHPSTIWLKSKDVDLTAFLGYDVPRTGGLYTFAVSTRTEDTYPVTYNFPGNEGSIEQFGFQPCVAGRAPLLDDHIDPVFRSLEGGRMIGQYTTQWHDATVSAAWTVCREGDACPPPPELPESAPDPCARAGQQQALADTCRSQLDALVESLAPRFAEYNARMAAAEANRSAFDDAQRACQLYDAAKKILEAILTGGTGPAAEVAQSLLYLRDVIDKAASGDLASLLYPAQVKQVLKAYKQAKAAWFELTADDLAKMNATLGGCSGKVPIDTYMKAQKFLEDLGAARTLWHDTVAPRINDLRSKGLECAYLDHAAWRACFADAECRGVPPDCGPEPSLEGAYDGP